MVCLEAVGWHVGDVEAVTLDLGVPSADDAKSTNVVHVSSSDFRAVVHVDIEVDGATAKVRDDLFPVLPDEAAEAWLVRCNDARIGVFA